MHPSEWKGTPAEADWDYGVGVKDGGYRKRERRVRWVEPVGTVVGEGAPWVGEGEGEWEWVVEEDAEVEEEHGKVEIWGEAVDLGIETGGVGEDPIEEMEDVFEYFDPSVYRRIGGDTGAGWLNTADTEGDLDNGAGGVPRQFDLARKPKVARGRARERLLDIVGREPGRFM